MVTTGSRNVSQWNEYKMYWIIEEAWSPNQNADPLFKTNCNLFFNIVTKAIWKHTRHMKISGDNKNVIVLYVRPACMSRQYCLDRHGKLSVQMCAHAVRPPGY